MLMFDCATALAKWRAPSGYPTELRTAGLRPLPRAFLQKMIYAPVSGRRLLTGEDLGFERGGFVSR